VPFAFAKWLFRFGAPPDPSSAYKVRFNGGVFRPWEGYVVGLEGLPVAKEFRHPQKVLDQDSDMAYIISMTTLEIRKVDNDLFHRYVERFGMIDTFCAPAITAKELEALMEKALRSGKPIPYRKAGWCFPPSDVVV
jgi:hypothetical protein